MGIAKKASFKSAIYGASPHNAMLKRQVMPSQTRPYSPAAQHNKAEPSLTWFRLVVGGV
jgi:hypothetical protein